MGDFSQVIGFSLNNAAAVIISYLPNILGGLLILVIGIIISVAVGHLVYALLRAVRLERIMDATGAGQAVRKVHRDLTLSKAIAWLVKWLLIIMTLVAASEVLGFPQITNFLNRVILYIPNIIAAAVAIVIGVAFGGFLEELTTRSLSNFNFRSSEIVGVVIKWAVIVFAFMAALVQLGIASSLIAILLAGFVAMLALAVGISFGLGGKDLAKDLLDRFRTEEQGRNGVGRNIGTGA